MERRSFLTKGLALSIAPQSFETIQKINNSDEIVVEKYQPGQPILYLATGVDGGAQNLGPNKFVENFTTASDPTCSTSGLSGLAKNNLWCGENTKSVGVPEYYWGKLLQFRQFHYFHNHNQEYQKFEHYK